jgi:hypothetical protein
LFPWSRVHESPSGRDPWKLLALAGGVNLLLGLSASARLGLEVGEIWRLSPDRRYFINAVSEILVALGAMSSGIGMMMRRPWSVSLATLAGTAGFVVTATDLAISGRNVRFIAVLFSETAREMPLSFTHGSRLLIMVIQALYWPILLGLLHINAADSPRERRSFWIRVGSAALLTGLVEILLKWILGSDG